jgi:hypothetical protein
MPNPTENDTYPDLRVAAPDPQRDLPSMARMIADAFHLSKSDEIADGYIGDSHFDWAVSQLVWKGDRIVHHWGVWNYLMRLGAARLKVGGVGAVATREEDRRRGIMHLAGKSSQRLMRAHGYDLSILHGGHYRQLGYVRAWNETVYHLDLTKWALQPVMQSIVALDDSYLPEVVSLYNREYAAYAGTAVRPTYHHLRIDDGFYGWLEGGRLAGYVRAQPDAGTQSLRCCEAAGDPQLGLAVLADLAGRTDCNRLTFSTLPPAHPLPRLLRSGTCRVEEEYEVEDGWKVAVIHMKSTLEKLCPLMEDRLINSPFSGWTGDLTLASDAEAIRLRIAAGRITIDEKPAMQNRMEGSAGIARLLIGSDDPGEIIDQEGIICSGEAETLAQTLFPNMHPMLCGLDEF